jgi:hypothetical protein
VLRLYADSAKKVYDGEALTAPGWTLRLSQEATITAKRMGDGSYKLSNGDVLTAVVQGSQTEVGTSTNQIINYKVVRNGIDVAHLYEINVYTGTLEVFPQT